MLVLMCLYISLSNGYFLIKCHLLIGMFLKLGRAGWYVVTKGRIFCALSLFVEVPFFQIWLRTLFFIRSIRLCRLLGYSLAGKRVLDWVIFSTKDFAEEYVLRRRGASSLINPFLTPCGWQEEKWVSWKVSVGLKCVRISRIACLLNLSPLNRVVSRKSISLSEIQLLV